MPAPQWNVWAQRMLAIAQSGLTYAENEYEIERYQSLQSLGHEVLAAHTDEAIERVADFFAEERGYATPKVDVRGAVFKDERILLVQERRDMCWTMPGGWADVGETPAEMVTREVHEEAGLEVRPLKVIAVHDRNRHVPEPSPFCIYKIFFLCELLGGEPRGSVETADARFFSEHDLPPLSNGRTSEDQIRAAYAHLRDPLRPADFD